MPDRDGRGPRRGSWMWSQGRRGPMAGHLQGNCARKRPS